MSEGTHSNRLPRLIEPAKLAQQELEIVGFVPASELKRVSAEVLDIDDVQCQLSFKVDEQYRRLASGKLTTKVALACQRCLEAVDHDIACDVKVAIIGDEAKAKNLPTWLDPWIVEGTEANLYEFVEDEILLNLPQFAWHEKDCIDPALYSSGEIPLEEEETLKKDNPFQMLEKLKSKD